MTSKKFIYATYPHLLQILSSLPICIMPERLHEQAGHCQSRHCRMIWCLMVILIRQAVQEQVDMEQCKSIFPYGLPIVEVSTASGFGCMTKEALSKIVSLCCFPFNSTTAMCL